MFDRLHKSRVLLGAAALCLATTAAQARLKEDLPYAYEQIWHTATRLLRADLGLEITDKDPEAGFLLFQYVDHGKRFPGSLQLVRRADHVSVELQVRGMPTYVERFLLDRLKRKLRREHGPPPPAKPEPSPPPSAPPEEGAPDEG